jgi:glucose/arabinose dehydrogenase
VAKGGRRTLKAARLRGRGIALVLAVALGVARPVHAGITESILASGLDSPIAMAIAPDGRIFVCEQRGTLRVIDGDLRDRPVVTVPTTAIEEEGLVGVALDPAFATTHWIYLLHTVTSPVRRNVITRVTESADTVLAGSAVDVFPLDTLGIQGKHTGGNMRFLPDGTMLVVSGEDYRPERAPSLTSLLGKVLRIRPDGSIPSDNPWYGATSGAYRAIWAKGFRNPYSFAVQRTTGRVFVNDVGDFSWEEVNDVVAGGDYGWPAAEGPDAAPGTIAPVHAYTHDDGCAVTGGVFYDPPNPVLPPAYVGKYFYGEYCQGMIRILDPASPAAYTVFRPALSPGPVAFDVGPDGALYYLARGNAGGVGGDWSSVGMVVRVGYSAAASPVVTTDPQSQTAAIGDTVTFTVAATGEAPLSYQWRRDNEAIFGETSPTLRVGPISGSDAGVAFRCMVSNAYGGVSSAPAVLTVTANASPVVTITQPASGATYDAGDTLRFSGYATDREDGVLPASSLTWTVEFHHDGFVQTVMPPTSGTSSGSFVIPDTGVTSASVWYRVLLQAHDSGGRVTTATRDVMPNTGTLKLVSAPPGFQLVLDGQPVWAPQSVLGVVGMKRTLGAVTPQVVNGVSYQFLGWSDGGPAIRVVVTAAGTLTLTAYFASEDSMVVVDWGGGYVGSDAPARGSLSTIEYGVDLGGGATGARWSCPYDDLAPLTPLASYHVGTSWRFYGGVLMESYTNAFPVKFAGVRDGGSADALASEGPVGAHGWDFRYWQQADFLGDARFATVAFGSGSVLEIRGYTGPAGDPARNTGALRFVVRDGTTFWVSEDHADSAASAADFVLTDPDAHRWAPFDPKGPAGLRFVAATAPFQPHRFTQVTAVGYLHANDAVPAPAAGAAPGVTIPRFRVRARLAGAAGVPPAPIVSRLEPCRPNPTSGPVTTAFALPRATHVRLELIDANGRSCAVLADEERPAGRHELEWRATVRPGLYWVTLEAAGRRESVKLVVTR